MRQRLPQALSHKGHEGMQQGHHGPEAVHQHLHTGQMLSATAALCGHLLVRVVNVFFPEVATVTETADRQELVVGQPVMQPGGCKALTSTSSR